MLGSNIPTYERECYHTKHYKVFLNEHTEGVNTTEGLNKVVGLFQNEIDAKVGILRREYQFMRFLKDEAIINEDDVGYKWTKLGLKGLTKTSCEAYFVKGTQTFSDFKKNFNAARRGEEKLGDNEIDQATLDAFNNMHMEDEEEDVDECDCINEENYNIPGKAEFYYNEERWAPCTILGYANGEYLIQDDEEDGIERPFSIRTDIVRLRD